jgi:hypothetical protein
MDLAAGGGGPMDAAAGCGSSSGGCERRSHKSATLSDNEKLRLIINSLYHMVFCKTKKK